MKLPEGAKPFQTRFVLTRKKSPDGSTKRYKARLVVRGYLQGYVDQTYAPVVDFNTIRVALALAIQRGYTIHQMDVKTAFLQGKIDEDIYVLPPRHSGIMLQPYQAFKLKKSLYGLKQSPKLWFETWKRLMLELCMKELCADQCVFRHGNVWILLYVDDIIIMGAKLKEVVSVKRRLSESLEMKDLGELHEFLGVSFTKDREGSWLSQKHFVEQMLSRFGMKNCKPVCTPAVTNEPGTETPSDDVDQRLYREIVGSLLFLSTRTRPDISAAVGLPSRRCSSPDDHALRAAKRVLRYLKGTTHFSLRIARKNGPLVAYSDSDWAGDPRDRKSTSGILLQLGKSSVY